MAVKGGKVDAAGEKIVSVRLATDTNNDTGLGDSVDPIRIDPTGTTVQPVSVQGTVTVTGGTGGGPATIADGADVAQGATTDAAVVTDVSGTLSGKLRGLVKIFADVWDSVNHRFNVAVQNFPSGFNVNNSPSVNQAGAPWTAQVVDGTTPTQKAAVSAAGAQKVDGSAVTQPVNVSQVSGAAVVAAAAGVQKVGVVGGAGTSLETTAGVIDENIKNIGNAAVVTAAAGVQKVGVVGGAGTSLETTAGVIDHNVKNIANAAVVTAATGVQKVGVVGNAGATVDSPIGAGTAPTNAVVAGVVFNAAPLAPTTGQSMAAQADAAGSTFVNIEGRKATFGAGAAQFTPAATPTDILVIQGSASKTVRIVRIIIGAVATTAGQFPCSISRRSSANTAGTSAVLASGKYDTNSAAATAVITRYTANATGLGTSVAGLGTFSVPLPLSGGNTILDFGSRPGGCLVLRGTSDFIVLNGSGATLPAGTALSLTVEFTEE